MCCVDRLNPQAKAAVRLRSNRTLSVRSDADYHTLGRRDATGRFRADLWQFVQWTEGQGYDVSSPTDPLTAFEDSKASTDSPLA